MNTKAAIWVGPYEATIAPPGERPAYWLRREFDLAETGRVAILRFSARGLVEVFLNGVRIGDELLPGFMQYEHRLPVRTYDVSEHVRLGRNAIAFMIADGWFRGQTGAMRAADQWGTATSAWAELDVDQDIVVGTDHEWRSAPSHILRADLISGQTEDRRRFAPEVMMPGFDASSWHAVALAESPLAALVDYDAPPVRRVEELAPIAITEPRPGVHVVDFGQNINGWTRLSNLGPDGTEITLTHGEWLDPDGDVTTDNLMVDFPFLPHPLAAGQIDSVVSAGRPGDVFEPRCTTHGFRYVRVEGHPGPLGPDDLRGVVGPQRSPAHRLVRVRRRASQSAPRRSRVEPARQHLRDPDRLPAPRARRLDGRLADLRTDRSVPVRRRGVQSEVARRRSPRPTRRRSGRQSRAVVPRRGLRRSGGSPARFGRLGGRDRPGAVVAVRGLRGHDSRSPSAGTRWSDGLRTPPALPERADPMRESPAEVIRSRTSSTCGIRASTGASGSNRASRWATSGRSSRPTSRRSPPPTCTDRRR